MIENGAGLSRVERITASGLADVLLDAWRSPYSAEFQASLPVAAVDGTLRRRFRSPGIEGRVRMKTGNLQDVSALAGYVNAASGRNYVAVIILNHPGADTGHGAAAADRARGLAVRTVMVRAPGLSNRGFGVTGR